MIPTNKKITVTKIKLLYRAFLTTIFLVTLYAVVNSIRSRYDTVQTIRQESICPALLSISRSARDTLIVMKAESLCNSYVLNNLK